VEQSQSCHRSLTGLDEVGVMESGTYHQNLPQTVIRTSGGGELKAQPQVCRVTARGRYQSTDMS